MNPPSKLLDCEGDLGDLLNYTQIDMLNYRKFALGLKIFTNNPCSFFLQPVYNDISIFGGLSNVTIGCLAWLLHLQEGLVTGFWCKCFFPLFLMNVILEHSFTAASMVDPRQNLEGGCECFYLAPLSFQLTSYYFHLGFPKVLSHSFKLLSPKPCLY